MWPRFAGLEFPTPWGVAAALGLVAAWCFARTRATRAGISASHIDLLVPLAVGAGVLVSLALAAWLPQGGASGVAVPRLSLFVALGTLVPFAAAYARLNALSSWRLLDALALPALLWLACVRVGCLLAGCCWGDVMGDHAASDPLHWLLAHTALHYPPGSFAMLQQQAQGLLAPDARASLPVYPVQACESMAAVALLAALQLRERSSHTAGSCFLLALSGYATARFALEFLRADTASTDVLTVNQLACLVVLAVAGGCALARARDRALDPRVAAQARESL